MKNTHTLLVCLASFAGIFANAQLFQTSIEVRAFEQGLGYGVVDTLTADTAGTISLNINHGGIFSTATATAQIGTLKTFSKSSAVGAFDINSGYANAQASFRDSLTVMGGVPDSAGTLLINLSFEGTLRGSGGPGSSTPASSWSSFAIQGGGAGVLASGTEYYGDVSYPTGSLIQYEIPFQFGQATPIFLGLNTASESRTYYADGTTVEGVANFSSSLYWGGISGVRIGDEIHPITEFLFSSDSGVNYTQSFAPVPEPAEYVGLFACGLVAFVLIRRRRI